MQRVNMIELNTTQMMLARHAIGWAMVPPSLTHSLPTSLDGARAYLRQAALQERILAAPLEINVEYMTAFVDTGGKYSDFFEHQRGVFGWYQQDHIGPLVLQDVRWVNEGVRRLRNIVDLWTAEEADLASDAPLTPFRSVRDLNQVFGSLSVFSFELMDVFSHCPLSGVQKFYCRDERRRRGLPS